MIIPDHKKMMATVMARRSHQGEPAAMATPMKPEVSMSEPGEPDGRHAAASDMISAFHEKSPQKLMESLANFMDLHHHKKDSEPSDSE